MRNQPKGNRLELQRRKLEAGGQKPETGKPKWPARDCAATVAEGDGGVAPIQWAIASGETETGVTVMKMDTGPIVSQRRTPILPADDSSTLHDRLARLGAELLAQTIPDFVAGKIQPEPQSAAGVSHAPKIQKEDGHIDWNQPAETIWNRLRAFTP